MSIQGSELKKYASKCYIETGSFHGDGIQDAIDAGFETIISIEITPKYYEECKYRFKDNDNVTIILGDSVEKLAEILKTLNHSCTIMLDAHWMWELSDHNGKIVPLLEEFEVIKEHAKTYNDTIMIDDMRCWTKEDFWYVDHQLTNEILIEKVKEINENYIISFADGNVENDVLVAHIEK